MELTLAGTKTRRMHDAALRAQAQAGVENVTVEIKVEPGREYVLVQIRDPFTRDLLTVSASSSERMFREPGQRLRFESFNGHLLVVDTSYRTRDLKLSVREMFWRLSDFAAAWERFQAAERVVCPVDGIAVNDRDLCPTCGVWAGPACTECGQRMYHADGCSNLDNGEAR